MVSPAFNVFRWTALVGGVVYGFSHDRALKASASAHHAESEYNKKAKLIEEAREEYRKLNPPKASASGVVSDINDPKFDPVKYIEHQLSSL